MPAAALPFIIGAASSVGSAYMQHRAAGKAADAQQHGADQAIRAQNQAYGTQQSLYQSMMGGASGTLGRLLAPPAGSTFAAPAGGPGQFTLPQQAQGAPGARPNPGMPSLGAGMRPGPLRPDPQGVPFGGGPQLPGQAQGNGLVKLRAPDGSIADVPAALAQQFIAKGAQPVNGPNMGGMRPPMNYGGMSLGQARGF